MTLVSQENAKYTLASHAVEHQRPNDDAIDLMQKMSIDKIRADVCRESAAEEVWRLSGKSMNKIIVIGCAGSGKSYFSKRLSNILEIPVYHLDNIWWKADGSHIPRDEFDNSLHQIFATDEWILDGDYSRTYKMRMEACNTIVFLDYSKEQCIAGIHQRVFAERTDCPINVINERLLYEVEQYHTQNRNEILELLDQYQEKKLYIFHTREEADVFLDTL